MKIKKAIAFITVAVIVAAALSGCAPKDSAVVMKIGGIDVRYDVFRFAVLMERSALEAKYGADALSKDNATDAIEEELRSGTLDYLKTMYTILSLASDYGIGPDDPAIVYAAEQMRASDAEDAGGDSELLDSIRETGANDYVYTFVLKVGAINDELYYAMINSGALVSDEESVRAFLESDECIRIRQILVTTENRTDERAREIAEEARSLAAEGADFDELISRYNEDMNMFGSTQGYYLMRGVTYREFEDASFALGVGEISAVIGTPDGYSVVKRLEKDPEYMQNHFERLSDDYLAAQFSLACEEREQTLGITDSESYEKIDILSIH